MTIDDRHPFAVAQRPGAATGRMPWRKRLRLKVLIYRIAELEHQLADEFATLDTVPILEELEVLRAEHDALLARFDPLGRDHLA